MNEKKKSVVIIFSIQLLFFLLLILTILFFIESINPLPVFLLFLVSGIILFFFTKKYVQGKKLRQWLMVNSLSATALVIFAILHNLFYALNTVVGNTILSSILSVLEGGSFLISIPLSPIVFLVSTVVVIINLVKDKKE